MPQPLAERFADYAVKLKYEDLPAAFVHEAKRRFIDSFATAVGAMPAEAFAVARKCALRNSGTPPATLLGLRGQIYVKQRTWRSFSWFKKATIAYTAAQSASGRPRFLALPLGVLITSAIVRSKFGKVLIAMRDAEGRTRFLGYRVEHLEQHLVGINPFGLGFKI